MGKSEAQSDYEISPTGDLSHLLIAQSLYFMRSRPRNGVTLAQLAGVVGAPGVDLARAGENGHEAGASQLKVYHFKFVHTLHSMRSVELTERAGSPKVKLLILGKSS